MATISARLLNGPWRNAFGVFVSDTSGLLYLVRCRAIYKLQSTKKNHRISPDSANVLCRTPHRVVLKQNLIRLVQSPVIKSDDSVNATSITIDSIEALPLSEKADVLFVVRWTTGVGDVSTDHSGNSQANLQKTQDGHCHVMGVAVRAGDSWIKAINTDSRSYRSKQILLS